MYGIAENLIHLDRSLAQVIEAYGALTYLLVFIAVFAEVGLVVTGFLPGDSLVFAVGAVAAAGALDPWLLFLLLSAAAAAGNIANFEIGRLMGPGLFEKERIPFIRKKQLLRARDFYLRHGGKTVLIARFLPVIRSFAPLAAGIAGMSPSRFAMFSAAAGAGWAGLYLWTGYFFGSIPFVKEHFPLVIAAVIIVTLLPGVAGFLVNAGAKRNGPA